MFSLLLRNCLAAVRSANSFDEAGRSLLEYLQQLVGAHIQNKQARLLRGTVHTLPGGCYQGLLIQTWYNNDQQTPPWLAPSNTLWSRIKQSSLVVVLDVFTARARVGSTNSPIETVLVPNTDGNSPSIHNFRIRLSTHVLAIPLLDLFGNARGMVTLEAECMANIGEIEFWDEVIDNCAALTEACAPLVLLDYESRDSRSSATQNAVLQVVGRRTSALPGVLAAFASQDLPVLICGAEGTGRTSLARAVHTRSAYHQGQLLELEANANTLEELQGKPGTRAKLEIAEQGTVLIRNLEQLTAEAQQQLLAIIRAGGYHDGHRGRHRSLASTRLVMTAKPDRLDPAFNTAGEILRIDLLPLAERGDEIHRWAQHFAQAQHYQRFSQGSCYFLRKAESVLSRLEWSGNLQQLKQVSETAYQLALLEANNLFEVQIDANHVEVAYRQVADSVNTQSIPALLKQAARLIADRSLTQLQAGEQPLADFVRANNVLFAAVWDDAAERLPEDSEQIAKALGKQRSLESRNYTKELRREQERWVRFTNLLED